MSDDELEVVRAAGIDRQIVAPGGFPSFYTNDTQIMTTPWDVRLTFGVIAGVDKEKNRATVHHVAEVRMSPMHAKRLLEVLTKQIEGYESSIGPIPLPRDDDDQ